MYSRPLNSAIRRQKSKKTSLIGYKKPPGSCESFTVGGSAYIAAADTSPLHMTSEEFKVSFASLVNPNNKIFFGKTFNICVMMYI